MASMGYDLKIKCPGTYEPQPEEILMDFMTDPRNDNLLRSVRNLDDTNIPENQVPQYYPVSVLSVFNVKASFKWGLDMDAIKMYVTHQRAVQIVLKNPGHYLAVVAYDYDTDELIYNDSWGSRYKDGKGGRIRRLSRKEYMSNAQPYYIVYGV